MQWSSEILDHYFAPKLSQLKSCNAPDVPDLPNFLGSLILNQLFSSSGYKEPVKILLYNFIGRLGPATREYRAGREDLQKFIASLPQHDQLGSHRRAVSHFESCVLQAHVSIVCLSGLKNVLPKQAPSMYVPGDNSDYDRLRLLNNRIKHFDEDVVAAAKAGKPIPLAPVWITNDGLESSNVYLKFSELADILVTQASDAKSFSEDYFKEAAALKAQGAPPS